MNREELMMMADAGCDSGARAGRESTARGAGRQAGAVGRDTLTPRRIAQASRAQKAGVVVLQTTTQSLQRKKHYFKKTTIPYPYIYIYNIYVQQNKGTRVDRCSADIVCVCARLTVPKHGAAPWSLAVAAMHPPALLLQCP